METMMDVGVDGCRRQRWGHKTMKWREWVSLFLWCGMDRKNSR